MAHRSISSSAAVLALAVSAYAQPAEPATPKAAVLGAVDQTGHNYTWTVTNNYSSPLVAVELPHFQIDTFVAPPGWDTDASEMNFNAAGVLKASAAPPNPGLAMGETLKLSGRVRPQGAHQGTADVTVRFQDGTTAIVRDVALPTKEPIVGKITRVVGVLVVGAIFIAVVALRGRKKPAPERASASPGSGP